MPRNANPRIDFDRYHARARTLRHRARADFVWRLVAWLGSLVAVAIILGTFWMLPSRDGDCAGCRPHAGLPHTAPSLH